MTLSRDLLGASYLPLVRSGHAGYQLYLLVPGVFTDNYGMVTSSPKNVFLPIDFNMKTFLKHLYSFIASEPHPFMKSLADVLWVREGCFVGSGKMFWVQGGYFGGSGGMEMSGEGS